MAAPVRLPLERRAGGYREKEADGFQWQKQTKTI
jgi:hypothetical protein